MWRADKSPDAPGRIENLKELVRALAEFDSLSGFLDHVALVMENEETAAGDRVNLMTLHGAKGLEFDTVFLPGWEEGVFPNQRSLDESGARAEGGTRLAYVGLTRARKRAIVSHAAHRRIYANWQDSIPSRFVEELPEEHVTRAARRRWRAMRASPRPACSPAAGQRGARAAHDRSVGNHPARSAPAATSVGSRVFHQKFGHGTVTGVDDQALIMAFDKAGAKRVLDSFVEKA